MGFVLSSIMSGYWEDSRGPFYVTFKWVTMYIDSNSRIPQKLES